MKLLSDLLQQVATDLGMDYIRSIYLQEADHYIHHNNYTKPLLIYNGMSNITTQFNGAEIIDVAEAAIYVMDKKPAKDMLGVNVDDFIHTQKRYCDAIYNQLNSRDIQDIEPYTLEAYEGFTDAYAGYLMTISIPVYNEGCVVKQYDFAVSDGGFTSNDFSYSINNGWRISLDQPASGNITKDESLENRTVSRVEVAVAMNIFASAGNFMNLKLNVTDGVSVLGVFDFGQLGGGNSTYIENIEIVTPMLFSQDNITIELEASNEVGSVIFVSDIRSLKYFVLD
jgi:hypothetical protein